MEKATPFRRPMNLLAFSFRSRRCPDERKRTLPDVDDVNHSPTPDSWGTRGERWTFSIRFACLYREKLFIAQKFHRQPMHNPKYTKLRGWLTGAASATVKGDESFEVAKSGSFWATRSLILMIFSWRFVDFRARRRYCVYLCVVFQNIFNACKIETIVSVNWSCFSYFWHHFFPMKSAYFSYLSNFLVFTNFNSYSLLRYYIRSVSIQNIGTLHLTCILQICILKN